MKKYKHILLVFLLFFSFSALAKEVALTIDDLPFVGNAKNNPKKLKREERRYNMILEALKTYRVPAMGFVVGGAIEPGQMALLEQFKKDGNLLANHSFSHHSVGQLGARRFIMDVEKADKVLAPLLTDPKYFRYPYLAKGRSCKTYLAVKNYLTENNYINVPVTIDSKDFGLNARLYAVPWRARKSRLPYFRQRYLNRVKYSIKKAEKETNRLAKGQPVKQIFLIHSNMLNAYFLGDVIQLFREQGYKFITVPEALKDPFYKTYEQRCTKT